ncbi:hypothetical protein Zmor_011400 [Zophobas morio]|uniref:Heat shock protein 70 n=1 Tax=Zophobas morio TaxID=2755281 RepID=A0AA38IT52_9CUCU|nr:hypothetical protein Zmor_011400 [Zophobas morio]
MSDTVVGIDLGTTNTCAACYLNGRVKILENEEGGRVTPSYIFVTEKSKIIVGQYARKMAEAKPEYGICEIKRLLGRKFDDPYVQNNLQYFPFKIVSQSNDPVLSILQKNDTFTKTPVDLCTAILSKVKADIESKIGTPVDKAVITVPAYFNISQREATLSAANKAGFTVLKLLNEPTAAALSYYLEHDKEENISVVYDLGGGTFDVAILKRNGNNIDIIGVDGDTHLGGHDFDNLIVNYVCDYLHSSYKYNPRNDHRAMRRLHNECEEAKKTLSMTEETTIVLSGFVKDVPIVEIELTRDQFEEMGHDLFQRTIDIIDNCLKSCNIALGDIKEIILSGGSTRIPKIQQMISSYFGKKPNKIVNPDECVAEGAALQAAMFSTNTEQQIHAFKITDVTPLSLGISNFVDLMTFCIERNTPIPVSKTLTRVTVDNQQKSMCFDVYEGERMDAKKNRHLGKVTISDITPAPPGKCEASFTMSIDANGILKVTAKEKLRNNVKNLTITYARGHQSDKEVKNALKDAEENKLEDDSFVKFAFLKEYVLDYCERAKYNLEKKNLQETYKQIYELCKVTKTEVEDLELGNEGRLRKLRDRIVTNCEPVVTKYNFELMPVQRQ